MPRIAVLTATLALAAACTRGPQSSELVSGAIPARSGGDARSASVVVLGDFGVGGSSERRVALAIRDRAASRRLDAVVTTGDNVYPSGHPDAFQNAWERPYGWLDRAGIPVVASLGNHDVRTAAGAPVMRLFRMPDRWYTRTIGPVEFIVLDSTRPSDREQLGFIERTTRTSTARWQVAIFHHPAHSCGSHGSTDYIRRRWTPLFRRGGVDLVLSGHDHSYQRFEPIGGVTYAVTGGGGAALTRVGRCPAGTPSPAASFSDLHYLALDVTPGEMRITAIRASDGLAADQATVPRLTPATPGPTVTSTSTTGGSG
ncbi:MAG: metallophosphoesterase family protein [Actinomycetota bacterium]